MTNAEKEQLISLEIEGKCLHPNMSMKFGCGFDCPDCGNLATGPAPLPGYYHDWNALMPVWIKFGERFGETIINQWMGPSMYRAVQGDIAVHSSDPATAMIEVMVGRLLAEKKEQNNDSNQEHR